ncbi:hypothetical protein BJX65DRAFT_307864 [Aspergillus insuetus]
MDDARIVEHCPLGVFIESHLGEQGEGAMYGRAASNWNKLLIIMNSNPPDPRMPALVNSLSESQARSGTLLFEWWFTRIQEPQLSQSAKEMIYGPLVQEENPKSAFRPELLRSLKESRDHAESYNYYSTLSLLWQAEFLLCYGTLDDVFISAVQGHRQDAALVASCQRTAWHAFHPLLCARESPQLDTQSANAPAPATFEDRVLSLPRYRAYGMSWVAQPCPWLKLRAKQIANHGTKEDLPFYLWDVEKRSTVPTETLPHRVSYVVISHTWGRWRKRDEPCVEVPGVPWKVPQNSRFEVQKLPEIVQNMDITAPYVWMDLLCIPQDRSDPDQARVYNREVDRQGVIFGSAKAGAIWLNDIESWGGLKAALSWLCLKYLIASRPDVDDRLRSQFHSATESANTPTGLFDTPGRPENNDEVERASGWFSSLWTLQEACLRPHMGLLNRERKGLFLGDSQSSLITLDALLALAKWVRLDYLLTGNIDDVPYSEIPQGPLELFRLLDRFQLSSLLEINQVTLLGMTSRRYCSHSRARAIMAAIGATGWWTDHVQRAGKEPPETDLVLDTFQSAFINEVREKVGAAFFGSVNVNQSSEMIDVALSSDGGLRSRFGRPVVGSMLPFSSRPDQQKESYVWSQDFHDHPSVRSWRICLDGSVEIREVGLVAVGDADEFMGFSKASSLPAAIMAFERNGTKVKQDTDLQQWVERVPPAFSPDGNVYAVCLCAGGLGGRDWGIILQEVPYQEQGRMDPLMADVRLMVKVGVYILKGIHQNREPETRKVDWVVL